MASEHGDRVTTSSPVPNQSSGEAAGRFARWSGAADTASNRPSKLFRVFAWLNAIGNLVIIGTGGAVRLTGSGLGCPTWPLCSETSWIPTDELTGHALIEFGNRLMSPVLAMLAVAMVLLAWTWRTRRRDLWALSLTILLGVVAQAIVGGITVLTKLNAWIVGGHYLISAALVGVGTALVLASGHDGVPRPLSGPAWLSGLGVLAALLLATLLTIGVFTTGNGPHSGDAGIVRNQELWNSLAHIHAWVAYALTAVMGILFIATLSLRLWRSFRAVIAIIVLLVVQIAVGIIQSNTGLPPLLVGVHMVLAGLSVAAIVYLHESRYVAPAPLTD